jgi:hypothetical protein
MEELCAERRPADRGDGVTRDPIAEYLADLDRRLRGRPNRDRLMAEAEDHLRESEAALRASGIDAEEAARTAIARLGPAGPVAAAGGGRTGVAAVLAAGAVVAGALNLAGVGALANVPEAFGAAGAGLLLAAALATPAVADTVAGTLAAHLPTADDLAPTRAEVAAIEERIAAIDAEQKAREEDRWAEYAANAFGGRR